MQLEPLPERVQILLDRIHAPRRLVAHLELVHDAAARLIGRLKIEFPTLDFEADTVAFGAATHDIGKADFRDELSLPGNRHEAHGRELLERLGVEPRLARFAVTHASWKTGDEVEFEDLLVALADTCWKGKRDDRLESLTVERIARKTGNEEWDVFSRLDEIVSAVAEDADARLAWQARFPVD